MTGTATTNPTSVPTIPITSSAAFTPSATMAERGSARTTTATAVDTIRRGCSCQLDDDSDVTDDKI